MTGVVPINVKDPTLHFTVTANGAPVQDLFPVLSIQVYHEINRISYAEIQIIDGTPSKATSGVIGDFPASDSSYFLPGGVVTITAGYGLSGEQPLFTGVIVKQSIQANDNGSFSLCITCKHTAVKMTVSKKDAVFMNQTDSAIMSSLLSTSGVAATVQTTTAINELLFQKFATDWDFLLARAEFNGFVVATGPEQVTVGPPMVSGSPVVLAGFGQSIISFQAEMNAEKQVPAVTATAWDPQTQTMLMAGATEPSLNQQGSPAPQALSAALASLPVQLVSNSPLTPEALQTWANSTLLRTRLQAFRGKVSFMGNAAVMPNTLMELTGVGTRFSGAAYVSAVSHSLKDGRWTTSVKFGLDSKPIYEREGFTYSPANGQLPAIQGLQLGEVVSISMDPGAEYRVQVKLASTAEGQLGTWARLANFYATMNAGDVFYPEIGDEVVVGFIENDPRYPVILGSLYSKGKMPPVTPMDNLNYIKALYTKAQLQITFDDLNKAITIATPGGNTVTMSDIGMGITVTDMNQNSIQMSPTGITINSMTNLSIQAMGSVSITGTTGVSISSPVSIAAAAANVALAASGSLEAVGTGAATFSSAGVTTVLGSLVMIN